MRNTKLEFRSHYHSGVSHLYAAFLKLIPNPLNSSKIIFYKISQKID